MKTSHTPTVGESATVCVDVLLTPTSITTFPCVITPNYTLPSQVDYHELTSNSPNDFDNYARDKDILQVLGEDRYQLLHNIILHYLSEITLPFKRGSYIESMSSYNNGPNKGVFFIFPCGINSFTRHEHRDAAEMIMQFEQYDATAGVRDDLCNKLRLKFRELNFKKSVYGSIEVTIAPKGVNDLYYQRFLDSMTYWFSTTTT